LIEQTFLALLSLTATWLSQDRRAAYRQWSCVAGMASQPFWLVATARAEQWGMFSLSVVYTLVWARGLKTFRWGGPVSNKKLQLKQAKALAVLKAKISHVATRPMTFAELRAELGGRGGDDYQFSRVLVSMVLSGSLNLSMHYSPKFRPVYCAKRIPATFKHELLSGEKRRGNVADC
jgi:hypothetical protein